MTTTSPPSRLVAAQQVYAKYAGAGVLLVGVLVMLGWLFDVDALKSILPGFATMKFNMALGFALGGGAILLLQKDRRRAALICAIVVALIGLLTLLEYIFGTNLGLDQWLVADTGSTAQYPGRMSPASALGIGLLGSSLLLMIRRRWVRLAQGVAVFAGFLALLAIMGYLYGVESLYRISTYSSVALHTALALLALSFGVLSLYPDQGVVAVFMSDSAGGLLARRLLPAALLLPPLLGWVRLFGQNAGLYDTRFGVSLFALSNVIVFSGLVMWTARSLNRVDHEREDAVDALRQANEDLEQRVEERTQQLRESEAKFSKAFQASPAAISIATLPDGRWIEFNEAFTKMTGYSSEELLGHTSAELGMVDDESRAKIIESVRAKGAVRDVEIQLHTKSNALVDVLVSVEQIELNGRACALSIQYDITERRQMEAALAAERNLLRTLIDTIPDYIFVKDTQGRFLMANKAVLAANNLTEFEQLAGKTDFEFFDAEIAQPFYDDEQAIIASGEGLFNREEPSVHLETGEAVWLATTKVPLKDEDGAITSLLGISRNITERKRAEDTLRENEERFRATFEQLAVGMAHTAPSGHWLRVNPKLCAILGYNSAEMLERTWQEMTYPDDLDADYAQARQVVAGELDAYSMEKRFIRKDGEVVWTNLTTSPVRDRAGEVKYGVAIIEDISQRKQIEAALRQQADLLELAHDAIMVRGVDSHITYWNKGACQVYGWTKEEAAGKMSHTLFQTQFPISEAATHTTLLETGQWEGELIHSRSDGRRQVMASRQALLRDERGQPTAILEINRDVTEQKLAEERLRHYTIELERSNEELNSFAYIASHDLQEPLRKIQAFGDRLKSKSEGLLDEQALDYLTRMQNAGARMQKLIQDLLVYSRVNTQVEPFTPVNLHEVLEEVLGDLEIHLQETGAVVEATPLPTINGDPSQMRQLFQNLISNALKFQRAEVPPVIQIGWRANGAGHEITVADNGIGFEEKYSERIFGVFERLHGRGEYEGTGIGLSICRKIVQRHGGTIVAQGVPGEGATFIITLPSLTGVQKTYG